MGKDIANAWLKTFSRTFVINLERREDRRREATHELRRIGLQIDGERVTFFRALEPLDAFPFASRGEKGCYLSHLEVLRQASAALEGVVLVMEDDFCFFRHFLRHGAEMLNDLSTREWDLAQLGALSYQAHPRFRRHPFWAAGRTWGFGTHCYAVRARAACQIVAFLESQIQAASGHLPLDLAMDRLLAVNMAVQIVSARRPIAFQRPSPSDLRSNATLRLPRIFRPFSELAYTEYVRAKLF